MGEFPLLSVIVPVYNVEKYILKCLQSLDSQTYDHFEVILVNDGSKDGSERIIHEFIKNKNKFHLFSKENGGVSSARNYGLKVARGEWITFIDSDDLVTPEYLSCMVDGLMQEPADFCMSGFDKFYEATGERKFSVLTKHNYGTFSEVYADLFWPSPVARLYSRELIEKYTIRFDERIKCGEDRAFNFDYLCHAKKLLVVEGSNYIYRIRPNSATTGGVHVSAKKHLYEHVQRFWENAGDVRILQEAYIGNHHFAHNVLDCFLADMINLVIEKDRKAYKKLVNSDLAVFLINNYNFKDASAKEKFLVALLRKKWNMGISLLVHMYYHKR